MYDLEPAYTMMDWGGDLFCFGWCNDTISHAVRYMRIMYDQDTDVDDLLTNYTKRLNLEALYYGGRVIGAQIQGDTVTPRNIRDFIRRLEGFNQLGPVITTVQDGIMQYLPPLEEEVEETVVDDIDLLFPDPEPVEAESSPLDLMPWIRALKAKGYTLTEIGRMTFNGMQKALDMVPDKGGNEWLQQEGLELG